MKFELYLSGFVIFSLIIITSSLYLSDVNTNYGSNIDTSKYGGVYVSLNETRDIVNSQKDQTLGKDVDTLDTANSMFSGGYSAIRLLVNSFGIMGGMLQAISQELGIPSFFIVGAMTILTLLIVFTLIYLVFRVIQ